jgi:hypothetical protein
MAIYRPLQPGLGLVAASQSACRANVKPNERESLPSISDLYAPPGPFQGEIAMKWLSGEIAMKWLSGASLFNLMLFYH